ncbi:HTH_Tnp_Tc3_2 domain-containing protein [Trichonephila clavipes]|nr:HTH_Tnp_Tc3_2 domain-containing protein [Trichonephila clavipes]
MANNQSVRRHLDAFTRGRIIGKLKEGRSVAAEFGIAHSIVSRLWRQFQTTGTAIRGSVVVVHEEPHPQMTDESRFSLSSDSHRILIWRERGSRNHPSNIIERDRYGGRGVLVWEASCLRRYGSAVPFHGRQCTMSSHSSCRTALESRRLAARTLPPVTIRELRLALQDEWAAMPQQLSDTLILSMGRRCETCLAVRGDHIPY